MKRPIRIIIKNVSISEGAQIAERLKLNTSGFLPARYARVPSEGRREFTLLKLV